MNVLIVGATRGLGASLTKQYSDQGNFVFATSRSSKTVQATGKVQFIENIDIAETAAGPSMVAAIKESSKTINLVIITAGYFATETFDEPNFENEVQMYKTSAIGPVFIVHHLVKAGLLAKDSKVVLVSSESGSITLRHESEGGGNYGHHASKAALNMVGKLLSLDLKEKGIAVGIVHVSYPLHIRFFTIETDSGEAWLHEDGDDQGRGFRQVLGCRWR